MATIVAEEIDMQNIIKYTIGLPLLISITAALIALVLIVNPLILLGEYIVTGEASWFIQEMMIDAIPKVWSPIKSAKK